MDKSMMIATRPQLGLCTILIKSPTFKTREGLEGVLKVFIKNVILLLTMLDLLTGVLIVGDNR